MIQIAWPWIFLVLPLPWLFRRLLKPAAPASEVAIHAPFIDHLPQYALTQTQPDSKIWPWLLGLLWLSLVLSASRPQWLGEPVTLPETGRALMLAVDASGSMDTRDLDGDHNRLDVIKQVASDFIARRKGDQIGLILFGTRAHIQTPLSFDRRTVTKLLNESVIGIAGKSTAIGDAIGLALKRLRNRKNLTSANSTNQAVLILLTDGSNTAGRVAPRQAARLAAEAGIRIYTIGVGAKQMRVRGWFGQRHINPSADLDEAMLKAIAKLSGGRYFRATDKKSLAEIYQELDKLEPSATHQQIVRPIDELYIWPLGFALFGSLLIALGRVLRQTFPDLKSRFRPPKLESIDLSGDKHRV